MIVNPLRIHPETISELEYNLLLCFTGRTRVSDHIIDDQVGRYESQESSTVNGLREAEGTGGGDEGRAAAAAA